MWALWAGTNGQKKKIRKNNCKKGVEQGCGHCGQAQMVGLGMCTWAQAGNASSIAQ